MDLNQFKRCALCGGELKGGERLTPLGAIACGNREACCRAASFQAEARRLREIGKSKLRNSS